MAFDSTIDVGAVVSIFSAGTLVVQLRNIRSTKYFLTCNYRRNYKIHVKTESYAHKSPKDSFFKFAHVAMLVTL